MISVLLALLVSTDVQAQRCHQRVDPHRIVLFLDANTGEREVAVARRAACERGETLMAVPQDFPAAQGRTDSRTVGAALRDISAQGAQVVSLAVSGHDGGGIYGSEKGSISRTELGYLFAAHPRLQESVRSLYLLGCYTSVRSEVFAWNEIFPNVAMIAGYEERAPLSDRPAGHTYLADLLRQEATLLATSEAQRIQRLLSSQIDNIEMLNAAIWLQTPQCNTTTGEFDAYYFRPNPLFGGRQKFQHVSQAECQQAITQSQSIRDSFTRYYHGSLPVPADTSRGELRQIYNFLQGNSHCFTPEMAMPTWDQALGLLFWEDFKMSAARWLEPEVATFQSELAGLSVPSLQRGFDEDHARLEEEETLLRARIAAWEANPAAEAQRLRADAAAAAAAVTALENSPEGQRAIRAIQDAQFNNQPYPADQLAFISRLQELQQRSKDAETLANVSTDDPENFLADRNYELDTILEAKNENREYRAELDEESLTYLREDIWLPTPANIEGLSRAELSRQSHQLARQAQNELLPPQMRERLHRIALATNTLMMETRCLPLSWHEDTGRRPSEEPSCDPTILER
jgi:hypothetical protein